MNRENSIFFDLIENTVTYDLEKSILLCRNKKTQNKKWIKKVEYSIYIINVIEDKNIFYVSCESDEISGFLMALNKSDGTNLWEIHGKSCFQVIFNKFLYSVFIDDKKKYFLLKINPENGASIWFRETTEDLIEYSFTKKRILLTYITGKTERISPETGENL
jgi:outer membrane protein assembly factor BamB